jgi:hypothetical protein
MIKNKTIWYSLIGLLLLLTVPVQAAVQTSDVNTHWAAVEINSATSEGWAYIENDKFNPNKSASREEVIWMLIGACKTVQVNGFDTNKKADMTAFKDQPSSWSKERMAIAIGNGYIQGYPDKTIKVQSNITRAEFAVMLSRLIESNTPEVLRLPFLDKIPQWSMDGINKVYGKEIIKGYTDKTFKPDNDVTKAEALVMIKRWKDGLLKDIPIPVEFKKILSSVKYSSISTNYAEINYYGKEGQTSQKPQGKYYIDYSGNNFSVVLNDFQQETVDSLANSLKILIPNKAEEILKEMQSLSDNKEKTIVDNGRRIIIGKMPTAVVISISDINSDSKLEQTKEKVK